MPTYDFRCPNGHEFEQFFRKISDAPSTVRCKVCDAEAERRVSGGAGLLFKGSGFYLTDYGRNAHRGNGDGAKGDPKPATPGESASGGGADSKPAAEPAKPAPTPAPKSSTGTGE